MGAFLFSSPTLTHLLHYLHKTSLPSMVTCPWRLPVKPSSLLVGENLSFLLVAFTSQAGKSEIYPMVLPPPTRGYMDVSLLSCKFLLCTCKQEVSKRLIALFAGVFMLAYI